VPEALSRAPTPLVAQDSVAPRTFPGEGKRANAYTDRRNFYKVEKWSSDGGATDQAASM
jgi:hypothetical protein